MREQPRNMLSRVWDIPLRGNFFQSDDDPACVEIRSKARHRERRDVSVCFGLMKKILIKLLSALVLFGGVAMATEEPVHVVTLREGAFEVRDYPAHIAAEVSVGGSRDEASNAGFRLLAAYIFGDNTSRQSIPMTAPVVQQPKSSEKIAMTAPVTQSSDADGWVVRFIMPGTYTLETLPTPNDPRVHLTPIAATRYAVVKFSGLANAGDVERQTGKLKTFIEQRKLRIVGVPSLSRYDPPWTLWFVRRNEVWIPIERAK